MFVPSSLTSDKIHNPHATYSAPIGIDCGFFLFVFNQSWENNSCKFIDWFETGFALMSHGQFANFDFLHQFGAKATQGKAETQNTFFVKLTKKLFNSRATYVLPVPRCLSVKWDADSVVGVAS